jgi:hypothetical protein
MDWIAGLQAALDRSEKESGNEEIVKRLDEIVNKLHHVGGLIEEQMILTARTGVKHLVDALNSEVPEVKGDEFRMARSAFASLSCVKPAGITSGTSATVRNSSLGLAQ